MTGLFWLNAIFLVAALSLDAFVAAFSYGVNKIKIPLKSALIITFVCSAVLAIALYLGYALGGFIPANVAKGVGIGLLILIGVIKLFDSLLKSYVKKHQNLDKKVNFKFFSLRCILSIYADETQADVDESKILSVKEATGLAIVLSLDSLGVGFGAGLSSRGLPWIIALSFAMGVTLVYLGAFLGRVVAKKSKLNLSWLSGAILITLGISRIFM